MKIWIDITNSPHVNFFKGLIADLLREHEVLITCRPLANTVELLELFGFSYHLVGKHYGQSKLKKTSGFPVRVLQLCNFLKKEAVDVAISHSSFYSPVVSRLLGVRCIYLNDNEHAEGNRISFVCADEIMVPEYLDLNKTRKQWARPDKIRKYPGVKEGIYLWHYRAKAPDGFEYVKSADRKSIYVRPEPWTAQ